MKKMFITMSALFAFGIMSAQTDTTTTGKSTNKVTTKSTTKTDEMSTNRQSNDTPGTQENTATPSEKKANTTIPSGSAHGATGRENGTGLERNDSGSTGGTNVSKTATTKKKQSRN